MDRGVIVEDVSSDQIFNHPSQGRTRVFLQSTLKQS